jgi:GT2 family glycosyltransferase
MSNLHYALKRQRDTLATRAALYRLKAIRDAGGFDKNIKGAGEDVDLSIRMHKRGWLLLMNNGEWVHIGRGGTWKGLWDQFWWYGYGMHLVSHKHEGSILLWQWTPPASLVAGLRRSIGTYKMTGKTTSFLLPLYFMFKNLAWILGYAKSNLDDYGHGTMTRQLSKTPTS